MAEQRRKHPGAARLAAVGMAVAAICAGLVLLLPDGARDGADERKATDGRSPAASIDPRAAARSLLSFENPVYTACQAVIGIKQTAEALRSTDDVAAVAADARALLQSATRVLRPLSRYFADVAPETGEGLVRIVSAARDIGTSTTPSPHLVQETDGAATELLRDGLECGPSRLPGTHKGQPAGAVYATTDGVELRLPVKHPALIGFHESLLSTALALEPHGTLQRNDNPSKFSAPEESQGPGYTVMATRGRSTPATSSSDIVVPAETVVRSPVTGRVAAVEDYVLYCEVPDIRVMIEVPGRDDLRVVLLHVDDVSVHAGQRVVAGRTRIGVPRVFYDSHPQFDQYVEGDMVHVHIEIDQDLDPPFPEC